MSSDLKTLQKPLESTNGIVVVLDENGKVSFINRIGASLLGYKQKDLVGVNWFDRVIPENIKSEIKSAFNEIIEKNIHSYTNFTNQLITADGSLITIEWTNTTLVNEENKNIGTFSLGTDVTEREINRERKVNQLQRSNDELAQFAYVISHDLKEPIRTIIGFTRLLEKKLAEILDETSIEYMDFIKGGASRMAELIDAILTYSRIDRHQVCNDQIDGNELVKKVCEDLSALISERNARIEFQNLPVFHADLPLMIQLFQNLISNAIKFHLAGKEVHVLISATQNDKSWTFAIKDNGIGISSEFHEKIFKIFQRLHTHDEYEGTGIGLAICKKIVNQHGGELWLESTPDVSSTFYFSIPKLTV